MMGYGVSTRSLQTPAKIDKQAPPASLFVDDNPDAHRQVHLCTYRCCTDTTSIEHAYRQSMPDSYGVGMSGMMGGMGVNNMPGSQLLMYGRGMNGYGVSLERLW
jgi:hypothetical protein